MNNREKLSRRSRYNKIYIVRQRVAINERDTAIFLFFDNAIDLLHAAHIYNEQLPIAMSLSQYAVYRSI